MVQIPTVEISDILDDNYLTGKSVKLRDVVVTEYNRGHLDDNDRIPYNGKIEKNGAGINFYGEEDDIGIDVMFIQSQKFAHKLSIEGKIFKDDLGNKYISIEDVDFV